MTKDNDYLDSSLVHKEHCHHMFFSMKAIADTHCKTANSLLGMSPPCKDAYRKVIELTQKCYQVEVTMPGLKK